MKVQETGNYYVFIKQHDSTWTAYSPSSCSNSTSGNMAPVLFVVFCQIYCLWPSQIYYIDKMCMRSWCHQTVKPLL